MSTEIHMAVTRAAKDMADGMDEQILAFFGSEELAREYAHLFVIEQLPIKFVTLQAPEPMSISYYAETEIRIRPKTMAELEAEKNV